jgi:hypothetical protein
MGLIAKNPLTSVAFGIVCLIVIYCIICLVVFWSGDTHTFDMMTFYIFAGDEKKTKKKNDSLQKKMDPLHLFHKK